MFFGICGGGPVQFPAVSLKIKVRIAKQLPRIPGSPPHQSGAVEDGAEEKFQRGLFLRGLAQAVRTRGKASVRFDPVSAYQP